MLELERGLRREAREQTVRAIDAVHNMEAALGSPAAVSVGKDLTEFMKEGGAQWETKARRIRTRV